MGNATGSIRETPVEARWMLGIGYNKKKRFGRLAPLLLGAACAALVACPKARPIAHSLTTQAPAAKATSSHRVSKGETLYGIARHYGVALAELLAANGLKETDILHIGQELFIPLASQTPHARGSASPEVRAKAMAGLVLEWPLRGMLYARFGKQGTQLHEGIALAAPLGTPIKAAAAGKVIHAGEEKGYGKIVILEHSVGIITLYAHTHELRVKAGEAVVAGATIATVGQSGRSRGPYLYFELRKNGIPVDPLPYFKPLP
ncbi:MAG: LysM peptidoglycan-binding domain-containing M23 family metallopeptidase [Cystobacterineae bacterium]|nr:LysM peptidoglycan-binding domain-containing M23 family metallopeptidase [Cystobacterineae bacterium]